MEDKWAPDRAIENGRGCCSAGGVIIGYFLLGEYEMHVGSTRNQQELSLCSTNQSEGWETPALASDQEDCKEVEMQ